MKGCAQCEAPWGRFGVWCRRLRLRAEQRKVDLEERMKIG